MATLSLEMFTAFIRYCATSYDVLGRSLQNFLLNTRVDFAIGEGGDPSDQRIGGGGDRVFCPSSESEILSRNPVPCICPCECLSCVCVCVC